MTFTNSIKTCYKKSFTIKGCASRSEYWWFALFMYLTMFAIIALAALIGAVFGLGDDPIGIAGLILAIFMVASIPANFCVTIRRLHDAGYSGWYFCLGFIPSIGGLILLIFMLFDSDAYSRYRSEEEKLESEMPEL